MRKQRVHGWHIRIVATAMIVLIMIASCGKTKPTATLAPPTATPEPTGDGQAHTVGDTWTRSADSMVMVYVPAGGFQMGSDIDDLKYAQQLCRMLYSGAMAISACQLTMSVDERPTHTVALDGFWIDRTEVTNDQYRQCVDAEVCSPPVESGSRTRDSYYGNDAYDDYPVVWVSWQQATDYCAWAEGRLPTEAEWEYAARGPESWVFPWGDTFDGTLLNYCDANCQHGPNDETVDDGYADTAPVGTYSPAGDSWCGAQDLAGNVREWVAGWFGYYAAGRQVNPTGPSSGESRVSRGGSWLDRPDDVRSANRGQNTLDYTRHKLGFRCAGDFQ